MWYGSLDELITVIYWSKNTCKKFQWLKFFKEYPNPIWHRKIIKANDHDDDNLKMGVTKNIGHITNMIIANYIFIFRNEEYMGEWRPGLETWGLKASLLTFLRLVKNVYYSNEWKFLCRFHLQRVLVWSLALLGSVILTLSVPLLICITTVGCFLRNWSLHN